MEKPPRPPWEKRWYLFQGQTLENTKIKDRGHALHVTQSGWKQLTGHLDRKKIAQEILDKEKEKRRVLREGNDEMIKNWDNSIYTLRMRKEEQRQQRLKEKEDKRVEMYYALKAEQEEVRRQYNEKVRRSMFISRGPPRSLNTALLITETAYERDRQLEFKQFLKNHEDEERDKYVASVKQAALDEIEENKEKKKKVDERNKKTTKFLKKQIADREKLLADEKKAQIEEEIEAFEALKQEGRLMDQISAEDKAKLKKKAKAEIMESLQMFEDEKILRAKEEAELDNCVDLYAKAKHRIECLKKQKMKEDMEAKVALRMAQGAKAAAIQKILDEKEDERIQKTIEEKDAADEAVRLAKLKKQEEYRLERIKDHEDFLERVRLEKEEEEQMKRWDMANRFKKDEVTIKHNILLEKNRQAFMKKYRDELLDQIKEIREERAEEKALEDKFILDTFAEEDAQFMEYANEVLEFAKKRGRKTYPIEKAIADYKFLNRLDEHPKEPYCEHLLTPDCQKIENGLTPKNPPTKQQENAKKVGQPKKNCWCTSKKKK